MLPDIRQDGRPGFHILAWGLFPGVDWDCIIEINMYFGINKSTTGEGEFFCLNS